MAKRCSKCGRMVEGKETILSNISQGGKYLFKGASMITEHLKSVPVVNIPGILVSLGCRCVSESIPEKFIKYKCSCGHSWIRKV
ncbi:hypothetical protein, partial [Parabacteroides sp.]